MTQDSSTARDSQAPRFEIFRKTDARDYAAHKIMALDDVSPVIAEGLTHFNAAGKGDGQQVNLLYGAPGFSLTHVWFKSGYPLPLHAHTSDCLYYILAGSIKIGTETLGRGDGFFVASDVPYTYTPGPEGVEVLEFRNTDKLNIKFMSKTSQAWEKIAATLLARRESWIDERPPTEAKV